MANRDYRSIRNDFEKALSGKDIRSIVKYQKELIESGVHGKGDWFRLAYFCGRVSMFDELQSFIQDNEVRIRNDFSDGLFRFRYSEDFGHINTFFQIGSRFPFLKPEDYDFLEGYSTKSGTYEMIDEMLFDKEMLQRELKHYEPQPIDNSKQICSQSLLDTIYHAALHNIDSYNIDELIAKRSYQLRDSYDPVYIYNIRINEVELTTSRILDERDKIIIGQDFSTVHLIQKYCAEIFGTADHVSGVLNEMDLLNPYFDIDMHVDAGILRLILKGLAHKLGLLKNDVRLHRLENILTEEWLRSVIS